MLCKVPQGDSHCDLVLEEDNAIIIDLKFDWKLSEDTSVCTKKSAE